MVINIHMYIGSFYSLCTIYSWFFLKARNSINFADNEPFVKFKTSQSAGIYGWWPTSFAKLNSTWYGPFMKCRKNMAVHAHMHYNSKSSNTYLKV